MRRQCSDGDGIRIVWVKIWNLEIVLDLIELNFETIKPFEPFITKKI
jgi:hypothetical protein